jgi:hypothetical protein
MLSSPDLVTAGPSWSLAIAYASSTRCRNKGNAEEICGFESNSFPLLRVV